MKKLYAVALALSATAALVTATTLGITNSATGQEKSAAKQPSAAAVARSRKMVRTLDNIYKQTIVLVTDKYVHDEDDFAAGSAAVLLFKNISDSGSHKVRLIDATGEPYEAANVAKDDFERTGLKRLKAGDESYDEVVHQGGKPHLRSITPVPVVMKKCIMCHEHYADVKPGAPIGAISYTIPIE